MKRRTVVIVVLLVIATALRAWHLDAQSIWFDEGFSWHAASQSTLAETVNGDPTNPPLYYLLLHIWIRLVGDSEFGLRSLSLLQGILLLAGIATVAQRWFGSRTAIIATGIATFTPLLWWASQEARMYNTLALAVLAMTAGLLALLDGRPTRRTWAAIVVGETAALYTHNTGIVVVGTANAVVGFVWLVGAVRRPNWYLLRRWVMAQTAILILWLPELLARFLNLSAANTASRTPLHLSSELVWQAWQALWSTSWEMVLDNPVRMQVLALVMLCTVFLPGLWSLRQRRGRLIWGISGALYVILLAALAILGVNFHARYIVMLVPIQIIAMAAGIALLPRRSVSTIGVVATGAAALAWSLLPGNPSPAYQHDQAREITRYYASELTASDLVLTWSYAERYELLYYAARMGLQATIVTLPDGSDPGSAAAIINAALPVDLPARVEINTWYTQASDRRGMLPCLVGHGNPVPFATHTVQGMTTTAYQLAAPITVPNFEPATARFTSAELIAIGLPTSPLPADQGVCIPVEVTVTAPLNAALNVAINLQNALGWEVAGADSPLLTDTQEPTTHLAPGTVVRAFPLIYLPQGAPAGDYPARIRVYSDAQPAGLDVLDPASGAPAGKDIFAGTVPLTAGHWTAFAPGCALPIADELTLTNCATLLPDNAVPAGTALPLTLAWQVNAQPDAPVTLTLNGNGWSVTDSASLESSGSVLDWRVLDIPATASGAAVLSAQLGEQQSVELGRLSVEPTAHLMTPPPFAVRSGIRFEEAGTLFGFSPALTDVRSGSPLTITLVWRATAPTDRPFHVTVQLLSADGRLIAQHDGQPAFGTRPTSGWVEGEYIVDTHELTFRGEATEYSGRASLIAALYDPADGQRLMTEAGSDHVVLNSNVLVTAP